MTMFISVNLSVAMTLKRLIASYTQSIVSYEERTSVKELLISDGPRSMFVGHCADS